MPVMGGHVKKVLFHVAAIVTANGAEALISDVESGGYTQLAIQIEGISGDTVTFEGTIDESTWYGMLFKDVTTGTEATTATADGIYVATVLGLKKVRARLTRSAGTVYATGLLVS